MKFESIRTFDEESIITPPVPEPLTTNVFPLTIALSDPTDADGDGISGTPHWNNVPSYVINNLRPNSIAQGGRYITRFGKKGAAYDLLHQTSGAYN